MKKAQKKLRLELEQKIKGVSAMSTMASRLDVTQIFCNLDDFCSTWEQGWQQVPKLPLMTGERSPDLSRDI